MGNSIKIKILSGLFMCIFFMVGCNGGGGGGGTTSTNEGGGTDTVTLTGQVAISSADLTSTSLKQDQISKATRAGIKFGTKADTVLPSAAVTIYKIYADGTEEAVSGITATTDANGNYTLTNVPVAETGTGASTDFYYEVRATSGGLEVIAATAPTSDTNVNISPETNIAAAMLTEVAEVSNAASANVLPTEGTIENLRSMVFANISSMTSFTPPSVATSNEANVIIAAEAVSSNDGNAEKLLRAYELQKEELYLQQNRSSVSESKVASYLERFTQAACDFNANTNLPQESSSALAGAFKNGETFTLDKVVTAFNNNNDGTVPDMTVDGAISSFSTTLNTLNSALTDKSDISSNALLALYANRGDLASISSSTIFEADQVLAIIQAMLPANQQCQGGVNYIGLVSELLGNDALAANPSFADVEVYHQRLQCPDSGSLEARVKLYLPKDITTNGVTISASGMTDTSGNSVASADLVADDFPAYGTSNWKLSGGSQQVCLAFNQTYGFTITASLSSRGPLTATVTRKVMDIPEAQITLITSDYTETQFQTGQPNTPTHITDERPIFKWTPVPGTDSATAIGAPSGTQIKYLYDITHFNITTGGPENRDFVNCPGEQNNTRFYDKDYILSPIDCNVDKCNAALPDAQHVCRLHVQTVLVNESDETLGWSAGADMYYCIQGQPNCQ